MITETFTIEGGISGDGELQIDGTVRGDVRVARVTVGESGRIEGSVQADILEARGAIVGSISAKQVRLYATAHVDGDITHEQLSMENGAFFQGRSLRFQREGAAAKPAVSVTPPKPAAASPSPDNDRPNGAAAAAG